MKIKLFDDDFNYKCKKALKKGAAYVTIAMGVSFFACNAKQDDTLQDTNNTVIETSIENDDEIDIESISSNDIVEVKEDYVPLTPSIKEEDTRKAVALTFDDGPGRYTEKLLNALDENDAKATFFVLGCNVERYKDVVKRAYDSGHEIGIHGYTHTYFTKLGVEGTREEIVDTYNKLREIDVEPGRLVRPPGMKYDEEIVDNIDYAFILWNVDTRDWESRDKDKIIKEIKENIDEGAIILLHDIHECSVDAIIEIIAELSKEYRFVTVDGLFDILNNSLEVNNVYRKVKVLEKTK